MCYKFSRTTRVLLIQLVALLHPNSATRARTHACDWGTGRQEIDSFSATPDSFFYRLTSLTHAKLGYDKISDYVCPRTAVGE